MMSDFNTQENDTTWALNKGIIKKCSIHNKLYDPFIGCHDCKQRLGEKEKMER